MHGVRPKPHILERHRRAAPVQPGRTAAQLCRSSKEWLGVHIERINDVRSSFLVAFEGGASVTPESSIVTVTSEPLIVAPLAGEVILTSAADAAEGRVATIVMDATQ